MTARRGQQGGQPGGDSQERTARRGQPGGDSQERIARRGCRGYYQERTQGILPGEDAGDTTRRGRRGYYQERTQGILPEELSQDLGLNRTPRTGQDSQDMTEHQGQDRTAMT
jgi:hypothetical protein